MQGSGSRRCLDGDRVQKSNSIGRSGSDAPIFVGLGCDRLIDAIDLFNRERLLPADDHLHRLWLTRGQGSEHGVGDNDIRFNFGFDRNRNRRITTDVIRGEDQLISQDSQRSIGVNLHCRFIGGRTAVTALFDDLSGQVRVVDFGLQNLPVGPTTVVSDTNSLDVKLFDDGSFEMNELASGDTVDNVLNYANYDCKKLIQSYEKQLINSGLPKEIILSYLNELRSIFSQLTYLDGAIAQ